MIGRITTVWPLACQQRIPCFLVFTVHVFDFSTVKDDICTARADSKLVKIKLTSCGEGKFTTMMANVWIWRKDVTRSQTAGMSLMKIIANCW